MALTIKQEAFAQAYVRLGDASAAYREAYAAEQSTPKSVNENASKLLRHTKVAPRIAALRSEIAGRDKYSIDRIAAELAAIGFARPFVVRGGKLDVRADLPADALAAVKTVKRRDGVVTEVSFHDKRAALVDLAKLLGHYSERYEHSGPGGGPIEVSGGLIERIIADPDAARHAHSILGRLAGDAGRAGVPPERGEVAPDAPPGGAE